MNRLWVRAALSALAVVGIAVASTGQAGARPPGQFEDPVEQGRYLTTIAGCIGCHTPVDENFQPIEDKRFAGGQPFDLGPLGVVFSKNLTSDVETGLGGWSDEEIKTAIRTGRSRDGLHLFPVMPYLYYNGMAESDLDAIVAFLRTLPPINNPVERRQVVPAEQLPQLPIQAGVAAPDPSDTAARGVYLLTSVIACSDCHTPVDAETGQPIREQYLSGGQPFIGPWGTIYGGNITPDPETGIGQWSDEDIRRVLHEGIRHDPNDSDGEWRRVVLMPWQEFTVLTDEDTAAVIHYLRNNVPAVEREVPAAALNEGFEIFVEPPAAAPATNTGLIVGIGAAAIIIVGGVVALLMRRRGATRAG
jgi:mono/diheme cytochrome c family protein